MNEKKGTMLNLEVELTDRAKELGINMSNVVNTTLRYLIEDSTLQPIRTDLVLVQQDIKRLTNEIEVRKLEFEGLETRRKALLEEESRLAGALSNADRDTKIAKALERIRSALIIKTPITEILAGEDIKSLEPLLGTITQEWLEEFSRRLETSE